MYEIYVDKLVKVVWKDGNQEKAVVGTVSDYGMSFLTLKVDRTGKYISIATSAITTVAEYVEGR